MNFFSPPSVIKADLFIRIPDSIRCIGQNSEWRGGFTRPFQDIFLEGPVADNAGNLFVVDVPYGRILRISPGKEVKVCATWNGEPNGLAATSDGQLLVADYKQVHGVKFKLVSQRLGDMLSLIPIPPTILILSQQGILICDPVTGSIKPYFTRRHLERFKGPNDLVVDSKGSIYFTDQGQTGMTDQTGKVYRLSLSGKLDRLVDNGSSPNGLVLSSDEKVLFVAMTRSNQVWRLPLHDDGTTTKAGVFFHSFGTAGPDGLALDEEGNLFICHPSLGSVFVVDPAGVPKARIISGTDGVNLTNCCFGGPDHRTLYITDSLEGCIQKVEWYCKGAMHAPGLRL